VSALDAWLAREAAAPRLRPGAGSQAVWGGAPGAPTGTALLFLHGFSASPDELSPYPQRVARALGASLFMPRLTGHGQDGAAMGEATLADWRRDVAEAFAVAREMGGRVIALGCSTGATLLALALAEGEAAAGAVLLSPNFGVRSRRLQLALDLPLAPLWVPRLMPGEAGRDLQGERARVWTGRYPATAFIPVARAIRAARRADLGAIRAPALLCLSEEDQVIDPRLARAALSRWGGPVAVHRVRHGPGDDPAAHVPAGMLSPGATDALVAATVAWARAL
jgi:esterase/lipase